MRKESNRETRIAMIMAEATAVFGSAERAKQWLNRRHLILGVTPLSMLDTEAGAYEVSAMLATIAAGDAVG